MFFAGPPIQLDFQGVLDMELLAGDDASGDCPAGCSVHGCHRCLRIHRCLHDVQDGLRGLGRLYCQSPRGFVSGE